jgi:sec-independent protein translocase protein TatA
VRERREEIMPTLAPLGIGPLEIGLIAAVLVVIFGATRIAGIGGALGRSIREFRRELREGQDEEEQAKTEEEPQAADEPEEKVKAKAEEEKKV